jgi:peptidoglycan hydrolase-like protein with peptidoglycan-binding domain
LVLALVCAAVAAYFVVLQRDSSQSAPTESGEAGTLTEAAAFRDLAEQESFEGTLGYEGATKLANQGSGIVTQLATEGSSVVAGEALYSLDGVPVTLMDGMVPAWRALGIALEDEALVNQLAGTITQLSAEGKTRVAGEVLYRVDGEPVVLMEGTVAASRALGLTLDDAPVVNQLSGTITQLSAESKTRSAGDVLYTVDPQPVVLMDGRVPAWRSLFLGVAKGADVRQLEENLVALGYDPDGDIVVNREFSYATQRAVLRWQDDLGITEDGIVGFGDVVFLEGEQKVVAQTSVSSAAGTSAVGIGSAVQPGSEILRVAARSALEPGPDVRQLEENLVALGYDPGGKIKVDARFNRSTEAAVERWQRDIGAGVDGVIDLGEVVFLPEAQRIVAQASDNSGATVGVGSTVQPGGEILRVAPLSNVPDPGQDILQLEENLVALGHDADGALVVDLEFDAATEAAVRSWQSVVGLEEDGVIELGEVVFLPGPQRVEAQLTAVGSAMQPGAQVLALTSDKQVVTLDLDADRQDLLAEGSSLMVDLPDGSTSEGIVTGISSVVTQPSQSADGTAAEPTVEVTIELVGAITVELAQAPVDVLITTDSRSGVLTVPLTALIALAGGGFAVEVIDGQTTKLVAVDPGLFTTGYVEVMNTTLKPGNEVVLPQG